MRLEVGRWLKVLQLTPSGSARVGVWVFRTWPEEGAVVCCQPA